MDYKEKIAFVKGFIAGQFTLAILTITVITITNLLPK